MMDFLLKRSQMPDGVEVPDWRSQASKWEAEGKLRVWISVSDGAGDAFAVGFDLAFGLMAVVFGDCDSLVILDFVVVIDEALGIVDVDEASATALATNALVTLRDDIDSTESVEFAC